MQTDVGRIKTVLLKHARDAFADQDRVDAQWQALGYADRPDYEAAIREYEGFAELLTGFGMQCHYLPPADSTTLDSLYTRDNAIATDGGVILCSMGKPARQVEPVEQLAFYERSGTGTTILGQIELPGTVEGGDVTWLTPRILAVGHGYRTNAAGIEQLRSLVSDHVEQLVEVPLPHFRGPDDVFHLMSIISPVASDLAVVYSPLMPVPFRNLLLDLGYRLVEVPEEEFDSLGCNVLAVAPGICVMVQGNPVTEQRLIDAGAEVHTIRADEICLKGWGGPTCLTRPLEREGFKVKG